MALTNDDKDFIVAVIVDSEKRLSKNLKQEVKSLASRIDSLEHKVDEIQDNITKALGDDYKMLQNHEKRIRALETN